MATPSMHKMAFPIETEEALKFWGSRHMCNRVKAIISFSLNEEDAMHNMRRFGIQYHVRKRAWKAWQHYVAQPNMDKLPFTPLSVPWWECLPGEPVPPAHGRWIRWDDTINWNDNEKWVEWIDDTPLEEKTNDDTTGVCSEEVTDTTGTVADK
ncbi:MAG: hypothetical protein ACRC6V_00600 [Bacteroidales bacterium]